MIAVVDYNMGNLGSVLNAFAKVGAKAELVRDPERLKAYDRVQLPGVGAFPDAMRSLEESGMAEAIREFAASGKPLMGTCLGMQLLFDESEEFGTHRGLGLIPGRVIRFDETKFDRPHKIPHMGWNELFVQKDSAIFAGLPREFYLYFVHSYHAVCDDAYAIGKTHYGYDFVSAVRHENVYGFQPHPEKSHNHGLKIVENFTKL
ncbi:imidazole glycerol phosphate synthase subunit HisH [Nitratifractor sp.]